MKTKREIAQIYFPKLTADSAVRKLTSWINNCKPLVRKLSRTGYKSGNHTLSRPSDINDLRLLRRALDTERLNIFFYFYLLIFSFYAQIVNILTNKIHARKSVRKYAILADFAMFWPSEHCKMSEKKRSFLRPKRPKKRPKSIDIEWS